MTGLDAEDDLMSDGVLRAPLSPRSKSVRYPGTSFGGRRGGCVVWAGCLVYPLVGGGSVSLRVNKVSEQEGKGVGEPSLRSVSSNLRWEPVVAGVDGLPERESVGSGDGTGRGLSMRYSMDTERTR